MNRIDPTRATVFIVVFGALAIFLSNTWPRNSQHQETIAYVPTRLSQREQHELQTAVAVRNTAQEAAAEHARFLARYLNSGFSRKPGLKMVAIVVTSDDGKFSRAVSAAVTSQFKNNSVEIVPSFFKPEFVSDGLFNSAFSDSSQIFKKLELSNSLDALLLAWQRVQYSANPTLENVITATMELEIGIFPADPSTESRTWTFRSSGAGFKREDARGMAEERLIKQIASDTKMSFPFTGNQDH